MRINRPQEEDFRPDLTSLVDVVFQLVIFFMVSSVFVSYTRQRNMDLPESAAKSTAEQVDSMTIEITRAEQVFLNGEKLPLTALMDKLQSIHGIPAVVIRADKDLPYGLVMELMEICERVGVTNIRTAVQ